MPNTESPGQGPVGIQTSEMSTHAPAIRPQTDASPTVNQTAIDIPHPEPDIWHRGFTRRGLFGAGAAVAGTAAAAWLAAKFGGFLDQQPSVVGPNPTRTPGQSLSPTASPTPGATPTENPTASPEPSPTLSPLEQNRLNWRNGTELNRTIQRFLTFGGHPVNFGLDTWVSDNQFGWHPYTGVILGAVEGQNGHIIAVIGMEDGSDQRNGFDVIIRLNDRMMINETTTKYDSYESDGEFAGSRDFYNRVLDGTYLNKPIMFNQPSTFRGLESTALPPNFPGLIDQIKINMPASQELHSFALAASQGSYFSLQMPNFNFVNADLSDPKNIDLSSLPLEFNPAVRI